MLFVFLREIKESFQTKHPRKFKNYQTSLKLIKITKLLNTYYKSLFKKLNLELLYKFEGIVCTALGSTSERAGRVQSLIVSHRTA